MKKLCPIGELENKIFIQNGFFCTNSRIKPSTPLHRHHYAEIHVVKEGKMYFWIENNTYTLTSGEALLIPARNYHSIKDYDDGTVRTTFQVDIDATEIVSRKLPAAILDEFFEGIRMSDTKDNYHELMAYIAVICSRMIDSINLKMSRNMTDSLIVSDFFENRYNDDVHVSDLSSLLHFSDRQTHLLVKRITGRTFRQELTYHRMKIAKYLEESTDLSMTEIAYMVGFKSYSGFWKAYKDFKNNSGNIK